MPTIQKPTSMLTALSLLAYLERYELTADQADRLLLKFAPNGREQLLYLANNDTGRAVAFGGDSCNDECINIYAGNLRDFGLNNLPFESEEYDYISFSPGEFARAAACVIRNLFEMSAPEPEDAEEETTLYETAYCRECGEPYALLDMFDPTSRPCIYCGGAVTRVGSDGLPLYDAAAAERQPGAGLGPVQTAEVLEDEAVYDSDSRYTCTGDDGCICASCTDEGWR